MTILLNATLGKFLRIMILNKQRNKKNLDLSTNYNYNNIIIIFARKYAFKELNKTFLHRKRRRRTLPENSFYIAIPCKTIQGF